MLSRFYMVEKNYNSPFPPVHHQQRKWIPGLMMFLPHQNADHPKVLTCHGPHHGLQPSAHLPTTPVFSDSSSPSASAFQGRLAEPHRDSSPQYWPGREERSSKSESKSLGRQDCDAGLQLTWDSCEKQGCVWSVNFQASQEARQCQWPDAGQGARPFSVSP